MGVGVEWVDQGTVRQRGEVFDFRPAVSLRMVVRTSTVASDGQLLELECVAGPHMRAPPLHVNPHQEESYEVLAGIYDVCVDGAWRHLRVGESLTVPRGVPHTAKNDHDAEAVVLNTHQPALRFEGFCRTLHRLVASGRVRSLWPRDPRSAIHVAMLFHEHRHEVALSRLPGWVLASLALLGRRLGCRLS
jgi:mannose-6-phosphate isomerase-like protein (cupin superfamily)